jgi:hypothetical protein
MRHSGRCATRLALAGLATLGLSGLALAMGGLGGGGKDSGMPARDFRAVFTDLDGTRMEVSRVTAGGDATLEGELGRGRLRVAFDNIASIRFQPSETERDRMRAEVRLREGEPVTIGVRSSTTFYGQTPGGAYQIRARDLRSVEFAH